MSRNLMDRALYAEDIHVRNPLAEELRVPLIGSPYPRWHYVTAVVVSDDLWVGQMPTDAELRIVASFHEEYCSYWYGPPHTGYRGRELDKRPYDIDGGAVGRYLIKHQHGGWGFRRHTWQYGRTFVPECNEEPADLITALDRASSHGDDGPSERWLRWKAEHPEVSAADCEVSGE